MSTDAAPTAEDKAKYDAAKKDLMQALARKRAADKQLVCLGFSILGGVTLLKLPKAALEVQIYNLESTYLMDTATHSGGNIIQGFDGYLKNPPGGRRKYEVNDTDRLFSNSSMSYKKVRTSFHSPQ
jgi:chromatin modification-related protein EAF6